MIGIFDSGVGGMTVARAIEQLLPEVPQIYLGDLARSPYGPKSDETITEYAIDNTNFLVKKGAEVIVIACNTAASIATDRLRREFSVPIFEVITPAAKAAAELSKNGQIGVIGTKATVRSDIYRKKIQALQPDFKIVSQACPLLVPLIEEGWTNHRETKMILRRYLHPLKEQQIDTLVLGCTHYPLLSQLISPRIGKKVKLVDSSHTTANFLQSQLPEKYLDLYANAKTPHTPAQNSYWVTDLSESACQLAEKIFNRSVNLRISR